MISRRLAWSFSHSPRTPQTPQVASSPLSTYAALFAPCNIRHFAHRCLGHDHDAPQHGHRCAVHDSVGLAVGLPRDSRVFAVRSLNATSDVERAMLPSRLLCFDSVLEHCVVEDPTAPRAGDDNGGADVRSIACVETPFGLDCYFNQ